MAPKTVEQKAEEVRRREAVRAAAHDRQQAEAARVVSNHQVK